MAFQWIIYTGILAIVFTTSLVKANSPQNVDENILALHDFEKGVIYYKDEFSKACFSAEANTKELGRRDEILIIPENLGSFGKDNSNSSLAKEFCQDFPIYSLAQFRNVATKRTKRGAPNGYYKQGGSSQSQIQGHVNGQGYFSSQAQSQSGKSQSQVQLSGSGILGRVSSSAGNAKTQVSLGEDSGSGQAGSGGSGPSNSQVQISLNRNARMASASVMAGNDVHGGHIQNQYGSGIQGSGLGISGSNSGYSRQETSSYRRQQHSATDYDYADSDNSGGHQNFGGGGSSNRGGHIDRSEYDDGDMNLNLGQSSRSKNQPAISPLKPDFITTNLIKTVRKHGQAGADCLGISYSSPAPCQSAQNSQSSNTHSSSSSSASNSGGSSSGSSGSGNIAGGYQGQYTKTVEISQSSGTGGGNTDTGREINYGGRGSSSGQHIQEGSELSGGHRQTSSSGSGNIAAGHSGQRRQYTQTVEVSQSSGAGGGNGDTRRGSFNYGGSSSSGQHIQTGGESSGVHQQTSVITEQDTIQTTTAPPVYRQTIYSSSNNRVNSDRDIGSSGSTNIAAGQRRQYTKTVEVSQFSGVEEDSRDSGRGFDYGGRGSTLGQHIQTGGESSGVHHQTSVFAEEDLIGNNYDSNAYVPQVTVRTQEHRPTIATAAPVYRQTHYSSSNNRFGSDSDTSSSSYGSTGRNVPHTVASSYGGGQAQAQTVYLGRGTSDFYSPSRQVTYGSNSYPGPPGVSHGSRNNNEYSGGGRSQTQYASYNTVTQDQREYATRRQESDTIGGTDEEDGNFNRRDQTTNNYQSLYDSSRNLNENSRATTSDGYIPTDRGYVRPYAQREQTQTDYHSRSSSINRYTTESSHIQLSNNRPTATYQFPPIIQETPSTTTSTPRPYISPSHVQSSYSKTQTIYHYGTNGYSPEQTTVYPSRYSPAATAQSYYATEYPTTTERLNGYRNGASGSGATYYQQPYEQSGFAPSYGVAHSGDSTSGKRVCSIVTFTCQVIVQSNGRAKICHPNTVQPASGISATNSEQEAGRIRQICCC